MKKRIVSPLCSALVVPGLGQVLNNQIKKGVIICLSVFAILIAGVVKIYLLIKASLKGLALNELYPEMVIARFKAQNHVFLWILSFVFICLWLYSVIDAFIVGKELDSKKEKNEIVSDR